MDYYERVIQERQDGLDSVEKLLGEVKDITVQINTKVHEQREDLVEIN